MSSIKNVFNFCSTQNSKELMLMSHGRIAGTSSATDPRPYGRLPSDADLKKTKTTNDNKAEKLHPSGVPPPYSNLINLMLTDLYQVTMAYSYWKTGRHEDIATFEMFFRKCPFKGKYTVIGGIHECLSFVSHIKMEDSDIEYLRNLPNFRGCDAAFFDVYLKNIQSQVRKVKIYAVEEGTLVFPRTPILTVVGPLGIAQLMETTLLNLVNFSSLVATNAARMVVASRQPNSYSHGPSKPKMVEFGLRRAQGPDGGMRASRYSILGGFDSTSNVLAGKLLGVAIGGTNAHSYIQSYKDLDEVKNVTLPNLLHPKERHHSINDFGNSNVKLLHAVLAYRREILPDRFPEYPWSTTNEGELAAFIAYAGSFPHGFLVLIDTYDVLRSGLLNFVMVAKALIDLGYVPRGIRLDSGDLAALSIECDRFFRHVMADEQDDHVRSGFGEVVERVGNANIQPNIDYRTSLTIAASDSINERVIYQMNTAGHAIGFFGIGTNLVTCQDQPALGCVYKLVEFGGTPRMKISSDPEKVLIPGRKVPYRIYVRDELEEQEDGNFGPDPDYATHSNDYDDEDGSVAGSALGSSPVHFGRPFFDLLAREDEAVPSGTNGSITGRPIKGGKGLPSITVGSSKLLEARPLHRLVFSDGKVNVPTPSVLVSRDYVLAQIRQMHSDVIRYEDPVDYEVRLTDKVYSDFHTIWSSAVRNKKPAKRFSTLKALRKSFNPVLGQKKK